MAYCLLSSLEGFVIVKTMTFAELSLDVSCLPSLTSPKIHLEMLEYDHFQGEERLNEKCVYYFLLDFFFHRGIFERIKGILTHFWLLCQLFRKRELEHIFLRVMVR